jgi:hypothetical protein
MGEAVPVGKKGRLVLPKEAKVMAHIEVDCQLDSGVLSSKAKEFGKIRLAGWREEEHEATQQLIDSMKKNSKW